MGDKPVQFMEACYLGVAEYELTNGRKFLGLVMEDLDKRYFLPFWENPSQEIRIRFTEAFKMFDKEYSNVGLID